MFEKLKLKLQNSRKDWQVAKGMAKLMLGSNKMMNTHKGFVGNVTNSLIGVVVLIVVAVMALILFAQLRSVNSWSGQANTTLTNIESSLGSSSNLFVLLILGAVFAAVIGMFVYYFRGQTQG